MSGLLAGLLSITLEQAGKQIGLSLLGASVTKLFDLIVKGEKETKPDPETKKQLDDILKKLDTLHSDIAAIGEQIAQLKLDLKVDQVQEFVNNLNALYIEYTAAYKELADAALLPGSPEKTQKYKKARGQVTHLGNRVTDEVFKYVENIHTYIAGQGSASLLALQNSQSMTKCDIFTYFCQMKTELLKYWAIEGKALTLLQLVNVDPNVDFANGATLIANVDKYVKSQEEFFNELVPASVIKLVTPWLKSPTGVQQIQFQSQASQYVWGSTGTSDQVCSISQAQMKPWTITPAQPLDPLNLNTTYYFWVSFAGAYLILVEPAVNPWGASTYNDKGPIPRPDPKPYWLIRPDVDGKFRLQYISGDALNNFYLSTITPDKQVAGLGNAKELDPSIQGERFIMDLA